MSHSRNRRLELILELQKHMVHNPTARLDELAVMAGIAPITLYRYFESREGLVRSIAEYIIDDFSIASDTVFRSRGDFYKSVNALVDFFVPRVDSAKFLFQLDSFIDSRSQMQDVYKKVLSYRRQFGEFVYKVVQKGVKEKYLKRDMDPKWMAQVFLWIMFGVREVRLGGRQTLDGVKQQVLSTLISGIHEESIVR